MAWHVEPLYTLLSFLDTHLSGIEFIVGKDISLADISVAGMMMYARALGFPFDELSNLGAWYGRIEGTGAWKATAAGPWRY